MDKRALFTSLVMITACGSAYETDEPTQEELLQAPELGGSGGDASMGGVGGTGGTGPNTGGTVGTGGTGVGPYCPDWTMGTWALLQNGTWELPNGSLYAGQHDARLLQSFPSSNFPTSQICTAQGGTGIARSCLLRWQIAGAIPAGKVVKEAFIDIYVTNPSVTGYGLYALKRDWAPTIVSWSYAQSTSDPWQVPGASGANDREAVAFATLNAPAAGGYGISVPVALAQDWVNTQAMKGVIIANPSVMATDNVQIASGQHVPATGFRPQLSIRYCP